ncbi:hypothetical protein ABXN37_21030 [Piscinibacter sakaiensis]|uniref:Uncharacterized protein n=1 Tax=Piscinibacter sakaiensis TaxID=1547922 RepID=A0A0K8P4M2_PISS1|nr:hypothetical protein [Piscinibacter sakaiensis]GAP37607.1 hypothetical protein ISF6_3552 [Piscinibacter sakaiensis]
MTGTDHGDEARKASEELQRRLEASADHPEHHEKTVWLTRRFNHGLAGAYQRHLVGLPG